MIYLQVLVSIPLIYFSYIYRKKILYELFSFYALCVHYLENNTYVKKILNLTNNEVHYDLEKKQNIFLSDIEDHCIGFTTITNQGRTKYIMFKDISRIFKKIDYDTPNIFSSVTMNYSNINSPIKHEINCESILNNFVINEIILYLDTTMAKIIFTLNNINTDNVDYDSIYWNVITKRAKLYEGKKIIFTIENNYNLRK